MAALWNDYPWSAVDHELMAYVWVQWATASQIRRLRALIPSERRALQEAAGQDPAIEDAGLEQEALDWVVGNGLVRDVLTLAGHYDCMARITAPSIQGLERLVLKVIHRIVPSTQTSIGLWPKVGGNPPHFPHPRGVCVGRRMPFEALLRLSVASGQLGEVYEAVQDLPSFYAESVVAGDFQLLLQLAADRRSPVQNGLLAAYDVPGVTHWDSHWVLTQIPAE